MRLRVLATVLLASVSGCGPDAGPPVMEFVEFSPAQPRIGEIVTVRFKLIDDRGLPLAGVKVDFKVQGTNANPGVSLAPASAISLKGSGYAETQVQVSGRVSSIIIAATSGPKTVLSPPLSFAGSVPNAGQMTFQCGPIAGPASGGRHAIGAYDLDRNLLAGITLDCTAHLGDRNGDGVPEGLVSFMVEAGTIGPTETSKSDVLGDATILYKTSLPLPKDVEPENFTWTPLQDSEHTGEYLAPIWMEPFNWVANPAVIPQPAPAMNPREPSRLEQIPGRRNKDGSQIRMNPRDNLVTMIAVTTGEEAFSDDNNNGVWDSNPAEPYVDLTEPFVDSNDNGTWDPDERFIDANGDKKWNGKNGRYDPTTLIWVSERILWTGVPHPVDGLNPSPTVSQILPAAPVTFQCPIGSMGGSCGYATPNGTPIPSYATLRVRLSDPWYNSIAQNGDSDGCSIPEPLAPGESRPPVRAAVIGGTIVNGGFAFNYPAGRTIELAVLDNRDPNAKPPDQIPRRTPPIGFSLPITCTFTASPNESYTTKIGLGEVVGTIE